MRFGHLVQSDEYAGGVLMCSRYGKTSTCLYGCGHTRSLWYHVTVVWLSQLSTPSHCIRYLHMLHYFTVYIRYPVEQFGN